MNNNEKALLRMWLIRQSIDKPVLSFPNKSRSETQGTIEVYPHDLISLLDEADKEKQLNVFRRALSRFLN